MEMYSTDAVPASRRFDYWCELVSNNLVSVSIDRETRDPFFGSLLTCEIGESRLLSVRSTSQRIVRTGQRISQDRKSLYLLNYVVEGRGCTSQHGNFRDIGAGDFFFHDSSSVGDLRMAGPFEVLTLSLSRALVDRYFAQAQYLCAAPLSVAHSATARVAADVLRSISENCLQMPGHCLETTVDSLVRIVAMAYGLSAQPNTSTAHSALLIRIRNYILAHLEEEGLTPKRVAAAHGISERYLSKLFESDATTVCKWIWVQRLEASRRALSMPEFAHQTINEVAYRYGFNDMSHFSFSFRKRYGCTPRQYRAGALGMEAAGHLQRRRPAPRDHEP
jgi:AraC-like DNA-binding protein